MSLVEPLDCHLPHVGLADNARPSDCKYETNVGPMDNPTKADTENSNQMPRLPSSPRLLSIFCQKSSSLCRGETSEAPPPPPPPNLMTVSPRVFIATTTMSQAALSGLLEPTT